MIFTESKVCFEDNCENRHPYPCKFGSRCKFNKKKICLYSRDNPANQIDKRCEEVEKIVNVLQKENENITKQFTHFALKMEKKLETVEKLEMQRKTLTDKEGQIYSLEIDLKALRKLLVRKWKLYKI